MNLHHPLAITNKVSGENMIKNFITAVGIFSMGSLFNLAQADVSINATRIIYPASKKEITFTVNNAGKKSSLIQAWLDEGNSKDTPDNTSAPFVLTPPISILQAEKGQNIRVRYTGEIALPTDKESLFWINVLEVPQNTDDPNQLRIGIRSRIKFFFRPEKLALSPENAPEKLSWKLINKNSKWHVLIHNSTPYYITFNQIHINTEKTKGSVDLSPQKSMISPNGDMEYEITAKSDEIKPGINFSVINDYGGSSSYTAKLAE
ncbi:molecular chaperone [Aquitalea sp. ASV15]|uniref:fimbrial biogenesis chaperone n=1 Tax=Aquitalea sp. ASV15 TaxID=2795104 RepID=UPI0018ECAF6C|nr:fimbria/pilus periplasmic chaperone [Aquitalea sp. ASV15]